MSSVLYINPSFNFAPIFIFKNLYKFILIETTIIDSKSIKNIINQFTTHGFELTGESINYLKFKDQNTSRIIEYFYHVNLNYLIDNSVKDIIKQRITLCDTLIYTTVTPLHNIIELLPKKFNLVCSSNIVNLDTCLENRINQVYLILENDVMYIPLGNDFDRMKRLIDNLNLI